MDAFFGMLQTLEFWQNLIVFVGIGSIVGYSIGLTKPDNRGIIMFRRILVIIVTVVFIFNLVTLVRPEPIHDPNWLIEQAGIDWVLVTAYFIWTYIGLWSAIALLEKRFPHGLIFFDSVFYREVTHPTKKK
jgi:hypothetical protein